MGSAILGKALQDVRPSSFCNVVLPISRVLCYPPPKSPSCEGDLLFLDICDLIPIPNGVGFCYVCGRRVGIAKFHKPSTFVTYPPNPLL